MNTTVDIQRIPYKRFGKNALLIIRLPEAAMIDKDMIDGLTRGLRAKVDDSVSVLCIRDDMSIELLPEDLMNRGGWYRKTP